MWKNTDDESSVLAKLIGLTNNNADNQILSGQMESNCLFSIFSLYFVSKWKIKCWSEILSTTSFISVIDTYSNIIGVISWGQRTERKYIWFWMQAGAWWRTWYLIIPGIRYDNAYWILDDIGSWWRTWYLISEGLVENQRHRYESGK